MNERPDFEAKKHGDHWSIAVLCGDRPRYYIIRCEDGALFELPSDQVPFVVVPHD